jgi:hypothetical protein
VTGWLRRGAAAASLAGERGDLWQPAMLASFVYGGWLPLLLVIAPPDGNDLEYFGVSLITSGVYPLNVVALSFAAVAACILLLLLAVVAETALDGLLRRRPIRNASRMAWSGLAILLLATLPVVVAGAGLVMAIVAAAPGVYISPDVETPVLARLAGAVLPYLVAVALAVLIGQSFGGLALRLAAAEDGRDTMGAIRAAARRLLRRPFGPVGVALVGWVKDLLLAAASYLLLRSLWSAVGDRLSAGPPLRPETLLLLVGFVGIWLAVLIVGGALHAFVSAWWLAELSSLPQGAGTASLPARQRDPV